MNKKIVKLIIVSFILITFFLAGHFALAANNAPAPTGPNVYRGLDKIANKTGLAGNVGNIDTYWTKVVGYVIKIALSFLSVIFVVNIITSGYLWLTAGGNSDQIGKAKKRITNSVIGMVIVLSVWSITDFLILKLACIIEFGGPSCA